MKLFTKIRNKFTKDSIWITEHFPVYTLGRRRNTNNILKPSTIPIIFTDRGGEITYHGPGQLIIYCLIDIKRLKLGIKNFIFFLEESIIKTLKSINIYGERKINQPGIYIKEKKIAFLGLRIKNGKSYHGISINTKMNLYPFQNINPCGFKNLQVTQVSEYYDIPLINLGKIFLQKIITQLYNNNCHYNLYCNESIL